MSDIVLSKNYIKIEHLIYFHMVLPDMDADYEGSNR